MKLRRALRAFLREAWFGPLPMREIVRKSRASQRTVNRFWDGLKAAGLLPPGPRPHFRTVTHVAAQPVVSDVVSADDYDPSADDHEPDVPPAPPAALDALRRHHPAFATMHASVDPHWLAIEDRRPHAGPTPDELRQAARAYDAATRGSTTERLSA